MAVLEVNRQLNLITYRALFLRIYTTPYLAHAYADWYSGAFWFCQFRSFGYFHIT